MIKELLKKRNNSQPINARTCGSVFRNPKGLFAAKLIEESKMNILCDSSFMCMSINLDIKTDENYICPRKYHNYNNYDIGKHLFGETKAVDTDVRLPERYIWSSGKMSLYGYNS